MTTFHANCRQLISDSLTTHQNKKFKHALYYARQGYLLHSKHLNSLTILT